MYLNDLYIMFGWGSGVVWCGVVWRVTVFIVDDGFVN